MAEKKETKNIEREYVIPLRKQVKKVPRYKKANKAVKTIKEFLVRHMQVRDRDLNKVKIDRHLNEMVWFRGIKRPPAKVKVKAVKDDKGIVRVESIQLMEGLKFKKTREEKRESNVKEKKKSLVEKAQGAMKGESKKLEENITDEKLEETMKKEIEMDKKEQKNAPEEEKVEKKTTKKKSVSKKG